MLPIVIGGFFQGLLATIFVLLCLLMCLIILIQKPRGGGLSGAFGGGGGGGAQSMLGGKSGDILTWITVGFFVAFLLVGMGLVAATRSDANAFRRPATEGVEAPADAAELPPIDLDLGEAPPLPTLGEAGSEAASDAPADTATVPATEPVSETPATEPDAEKPQ